MVRYRVSGRGSTKQSAGSFKTLKDARARRDWVIGELASMRVPDLDLMKSPAVGPTLRAIAAAWQKSRVDVADGTAATHRVNLGRVLPDLGTRLLDEITATDVAQLVADMNDKGLARESIRKTIGTLAMVFDFAGVQPNPARDRVAVRMPRDDTDEVDPPIADHVLAVWWVIPEAYKLALLVLDATGLRVGELEQLQWGDLDEAGLRFRIRRAVTKTRKGRFVPVPQAIMDAIAELVAREDRTLAGQVFADFGADALRTAMGRACKTAAVPAFSPHDLRHRRATLWHLGGVPVAQASAWLGHSATEHVKTYAHASLTDRAELDYVALTRRASDRGLSVPTPD